MVLNIKFLPAWRPVADIAVAVAADGVGFHVLSVPAAAVDLKRISVHGMVVIAVRVLLVRIDLKRAVLHRLPEARKIFVQVARVAAVGRGVGTVRRVLHDLLVPIEKEELLRHVPRVPVDPVVRVVVAAGVLRSPLDVLPVGIKA
jgi:hypothetical protein